MQKYYVITFSTFSNAEQYNSDSKFRAAVMYKYFDYKENFRQKMCHLRLKLYLKSSEKYRVPIYNENLRTII